MLDSFPNICIVYRILLTIHVIVASTYRSFSKLKLIKSYPAKMNNVLRKITLISYIIDWKWDIRINLHFKRREKYFLNEIYYNIKY